MEKDVLFVVGIVSELIGWAGRTWSSQCPYNNDAFLMQISTLIIGMALFFRNTIETSIDKMCKAPTFFTAAIYIILGRLIQIKGRHTSPISPKMYLYIFCTADVISLVVQAVGGGIASNASSEVNGNTKPGTDIMVAGILFQMASIIIFCVLGVNFLIKTRNDTFEPRLKILVAATTLSIVVIVIRSIYRSIELLQGWDGFLITHERYFVALDGAMMVIAVGVFNVANPAWLLQGTAKGADTTLRGSDEIEMVDPRMKDEKPIESED
ncbi:hypothetical protein ACLMJK_006174 [Lecanora helva]